LTTLQHAAVFDWLYQVAFFHLRISAFFLVAPILSANPLNLQVRLAIVSLVAILVAGQVQAPLPAAEDMWPRVVLAVREVILGSSLGLFLRVLFNAAAAAGEVIAATMGLSFAAMVDPSSGEGNPIVAQLLNQLMLIGFLSVQGPMLILGLLVRSYTTWPPANAGLPVGMLAEVGASVGPMLVQAMVLMSPVVFVVVLMNIGTGILNRLAPQMNMFSIGTPLALLIGGAALVVFMPDISVKLVALVNDALTATDALLSTHPVK